MLPSVRLHWVFLLVIVVAVGLILAESGAITSGTTIPPADYSPIPLAGGEINMPRLGLGENM
jgi:hypothetical protein